jgi:hypothetical protein
MLQAKLLPKILEQGVSGGVSAVLLLNEKGEPIGMAPPRSRFKHAGAIAAHIWASYEKLNPTATAPP